MTARRVLRDCTPPIVWRLVRWAAGLPSLPTSTYQGVTTEHDMWSLHHGLFGHVFNRAAAADPFVNPESVRLRIYLAAVVAAFVEEVNGDFLFGGVSYGVGPRAIFELLGARTPRRYWLIDPFTGIDGDGATRTTYNQDALAIALQYSPGAPIELVRTLLPDALEEIDARRPIAFAWLNTGAPRAEIESLPELYRRLAPGGALLIDSYAFGGRGLRSSYADALAQFGEIAYTLPTGQGLVRKPAAP